MVRTSTHAENISQLAIEMITLGCDPAGNYCPNDGVTRAQMATFLARTLALDPVDENPFTDVVTGSTHAGNINAVRVEGITLGCDATGTMFWSGRRRHPGTNGDIPCTHAGPRPSRRESVH